VPTPKVGVLLQRALLFHLNLTYSTEICNYSIHVTKLLSTVDFPSPLEDDMSSVMSSEYLLTYVPSSRNSIRIFIRTLTINQMSHNQFAIRTSRAHLSSIYLTVPRKYDSRTPRVWSIRMLLWVRRLDVAEDLYRAGVTRSSKSFDFLAATGVASDDTSKFTGGLWV
jgi:hypothetical protein